jgi:UDP-2,4-diacetamido-2,4,6-trideoxy-beta-L-altropyranose hydrolase
MSPESIKYRFLIRCDAGPEYGYGHLARCKALYSALTAEGHDCLILLNPDGAETSLARDFPPEKLIKPSENFENLCQDNFDAVIIDHYALESPNTGHALLVRLNDIPANAPACDVLIDTNFGRTERDYADWSSDNRKVIAGHKYALLDERFQQLQKPLAKTDFLSRQHVFISFGGIDSKNLTLKALQALEIWEPRDLRFDIVVGKHHHDLISIISLTTRLKNAGLEIDLQVDSNDVPNLLAKAGLAIGTAGNSMWERCCLAVPSLVFCVAENQKAMINFAISQKVAAKVDFLCHPPQLAHLLRVYWEDANLRYKMAQLGPKVCDGRGSERVVSQLVRQLANRKSSAH